MKIRPEKNQTCMGVKPRTSAIPVLPTELISQLGAGHFVGL